MREVRYRARSSFAVIVALLVVACGYSRANEYPEIYHETTITADANGTIFVSQPGLNRVSLYDAYWWHIKDINNVDQALGMAVVDDRLFVGSGNQIAIYDVSSGVRIGAFDYQFEQVNDIEAVSSDLLYVADSKADKIKVFNSSGELQFEFGASGDGEGELDFPAALTVDESANKVFVGDQNNSRIVVFDLDGNFVTSFGRHTYQDPVTFEWVFEGTFSCIHGLACSQDGRLYIADSYQSNVQVLDYDGNCLGFIGKFGNAPGDFKLPQDVFCHGDQLLVSSHASSKVEIFGKLPTGVDDPGSDAAMPTGFRLNQNYPNPFNPTTRIDFYLDHSGYVTLTLYNILGQQVTSLVNGFFPRGGHSVEWNATDGDGRPAASGIYFYRLKRGDQSVTKRMLLLR